MKTYGPGLPESVGGPGGTASNGISRGPGGTASNGISGSPGGSRGLRAGKFDLLVLGSGPAGLAAAAAAKRAGADCCVVEREERPGGILKQCIHDGFGLVRFKERLTGPEYAWREIEAVRNLDIPLLLSTYLTRVERLPGDGGFALTGLSSRGMVHLESKALILATGCRERTGRQIFLHGSRPAGVFTAGLVQYMINIQGYLPARRCVILGSGDIGLIMARRLTLEGAEVEGVYEIMDKPSGLPRNIAQCLEDFSIPLHLSTTVTRVHGRDRVEGVTLARVDGFCRPLPGSERFVPCDGLILSVGLIPENEIAESLGVEMDPLTLGPVVNDEMMTSVDGLFCCGNALHVSDLADSVSATGELAGVSAALYAAGSAEGQGAANDLSLPLSPGEALTYMVPQRVRLLVLQAGAQTPGAAGDAVCCRFRVKRETGKCRLVIVGIDRNGKRQELAESRYPFLRPSEMEEITLPRSALASFFPDPAGTGASGAPVRLEAVLEEDDA
jgi:thioredoxin reductase